MKNKLPCPSAIVFVEEMNKKFKGTNHRRTKLVNPRPCEDVFIAVPGLKYDKIILSTTWDGRKPQTSVHAFIERKTGYLIKAANWSSPQKNSDGTLAVRYHLNDENMVAMVVNNADIHGSYLYLKA